MHRQGFLLINLGTPDAPREAEVRRYLKEFLSDPRVLDMNPIQRAFLLRFVILPKRPRESAAAYAKIWTDRGSPLLFHGEDLASKIAARLGDRYRVALAMRYGTPSIGAALGRMRDDGIDDIVAFPLFPQYSSAATGSAVERLFAEASRLWNVPALRVVPPYYAHTKYIGALVQVTRPVLDAFQPDRVLFSYHGLPERHVRKSDESRGGHCLRSANCCDAIGPANRNCYRAHCFATTRALAERLGLAAGTWQVAFQSRLGRDPWIRPYTDVVIRELGAAGVRRLAVVCPSFTADCLETLEEIGMRGRDDFVAAGGTELRLVPALNSEDVWARAVVDIAREGMA